MVKKWFDCIFTWALFTRCCFKQLLSWFAAKRLYGTVVLTAFSACDRKWKIMRFKSWKSIICSAIAVTLIALEIYQLLKKINLKSVVLNSHAPCLISASPRLPEWLCNLIVKAVIHLSSVSLVGCLFLLHSHLCMYCSLVTCIDKEKRTYTVPSGFPEGH